MKLTGAVALKRSSIMKNKILSLLLSVFLIMCILPVTSTAAEEGPYTYGNLVYVRINTGYCRIVGCKPGVGGTLFIPKKISNMTVAEISEGAFASIPIKTLAVEGNGLAIRKGAFKNCPIEVLTVYNGVEHIYPEAFAGCPIERMYLPKSLTQIDKNAFSPLSDNRKTEINYSGTKSNWNSMIIDSSNSVFANGNFNYSVSYGYEYNNPELQLNFTDGLYEPLTLTATDTADIAGYYIGTDDTYYENEFITTKLTSVLWDIEFPNLYYFTAADINGNISETFTAKFIRYSLDGNEISDMYKSVLIKADTEVTPSAPVINTSDVFKGWSEDPDDTEGEMSFIPEDGKTYYAIWDKVSPSDREIALSHRIDGEVLALTVGLKEAKGLKTGELQVNYDAEALRFREVKGYDKYYGVDCYKAADENFCIGFSVMYDSGLPSDDNELCTLYFDILKRDGSKTDITVSGRWALEATKAATEKVNIPLIPREFSLKEAISEDTFFVNLSIEKGKYLTDGTLALEYDSDVFTLTDVHLVSGWEVTAASPVNNKSSVSFSCPDGKKLSDEKYDICMFIFKITDRNAGEKTIKISGTGELSSAKGDFVTVNLQYVPETPEYTLGDVDNDGSITAADARLALRASVGLEMFNELQTLAADTDKNKEITAADARMILRASVGLEKLS